MGSKPVLPSSDDLLCQRLDKLIDKRYPLVQLAERTGIGLRQNYNRVGLMLVGAEGRYAHVRQFRRMRVSLRKLETVTGRVCCEIKRKVEQIPVAMRTGADELLHLVERLLTKKIND